MPDISNPYFMQISKAIEDVLAPHGFSLILPVQMKRAIKQGC